MLSYQSISHNGWFIMENPIEIDDLENPMVRRSDSELGVSIVPIKWIAVWSYREFPSHLKIESWDSASFFIGTSWTVIKRYEQLS